MLILTQQPDDLAFSRNPLIVSIRALDGDGNPYGPAGIKATMNTDVAFGEGDSFDVNFTEPDGTQTSITFTAVASPSGPTELQAGLGPFSTLIDVYIFNMGIVVTHPLIDPFFQSITSENIITNITLTLEVSDPVAGWYVEFDITGISTPGFTADTVTEVTDTTPPNYKVILEVFFESTYNSAEFSKTATLSSIPDSNGYTLFDLSDIIDAATRTSMAEVPIPAFSDDVPYIADIFRRYYFRYRESYDDIVGAAWTVSDTKRVLCGGISQALFANFDFFASLLEDNSLLGWYPDRKRVGVDQPEWIAWYNYTLTEKNIVLQVVETNASTIEFPLYAFDASPLAVPSGEVAIIPVSPTVLTLAADTQKYQVRVTDDDSDWEIGSPIFLSQQRTYYVDRCEYLSERYIMYLDGFCTPKTLRCIGEHITDLDIDRLETNRILTPSYTATSPEITQYKEIWRNILTYNTGHLTRNEIDALQELLIYNQSWEVYPFGYIPLHLTGNSFFIRRTREGLPSLTIQAEPRLRMKNYSNLLIAIEEIEEGWQTDELEFWQTALGLPWETP